MTYIFKKVGKKHSVRMHLVKIEDDGSWWMENDSYKGLFYKVKNPKEELEAIEND